MPKGVPNAKTAKAEEPEEEEEVKAEKTVTKAPKASITVTPTETFMGRTVMIATSGIEGPLRLEGATQKWDVHLDDSGGARWSFQHPGEFELTSTEGPSETITVSAGD